ncbi:menaquinone-dependent protoporphyrinogen IX dehydrogenase [Actinobacillus seminis]|uniref:menaquinone-dependent protoporphyrinogen IX dehydrogenase n=1 Tax=Actinobacillus seminis TaxID=722 RepID=UPI003B931F87
MKTLILYATHDGQTKKIAEFIASLLEGEVTLTCLADSVSLIEFDRIIIGASVRYGHFDRALYEFVQKNTALLHQKSSVFFGVNLTARKAGKDSAETNVYVRKFLQRIDWKPTFVAVFAGALFYPRYTWFDRVMIQFIMRITGGETDTSKEIEYTDWEKVKAFVQKIQKMN